jgi:hypothetical protein
MEEVIPAIAMAKPVRGAADRIHPTGMSGPHHRMDSKIVTPHAAKLFRLLPAFPNSSGAGQRCSRVESRGEARTRAHRGDSSGRRTSPPIPAPGSVVVVRRCSTIMASDILPWSCESKQMFASQDQVSSRLRILFCTRRFASQNTLLRCFEASKFAQLLRQTVNRCSRGSR